MDFLDNVDAELVFRVDVHQPEDVLANCLILRQVVHLLVGYLYVYHQENPNLGERLVR